ncbi:MAG: 3-carboxy-cis,cis-muconate cycloisomerase [Acidobacteria bacterium]|nr:3-carboxy-cis,cis-muconate cycloisomerase [Acidobacteriota bacterium]
MTLLEPLFRWEAVEAFFSDEARLQAMLDFESALVRAEARAGVIPPTAAAPISAKCKAELFDLDELARAAAKAGNVAIPLVKQLTKLVAERDTEAARYVHWGATSQDVIDTGLVLQLRSALRLMDGELAGLTDSIAKLVEQHRSTVTVARTWMQQALPTTLGLEMAGWLDALDRDRLRLRESGARCLVLQFGGAAGTLAALGSKGMRVAEALGAELQLPVPPLPWHSHRDRTAEICMTAGMCAGTLGKIARDISLAAQTEVGEMFEPAGEGRGGSSTMPHKRNPVACAVVLSAAMRIPGLVSTMLSSMVQEQERGLGGWHAEWETLPEIVSLTAGALHHLSDAVGGLEINAEKMCENLERTNGLIFAEAVQMALASKIGRMQAHELLERASNRVVSETRHLRDVLKEDAIVRQHLTDDELARLFEPTEYLGATQAFLDRVLAAHASFRPKSASKSD